MADLSERARLVLKLAQHEALRFDHEFVGTEHILLGLRREGPGAASGTLSELGLDIRTLRLGVEGMAESGRIMLEHPRPWTPRAARILRFARHASWALGSLDVAPEHLLLGLLRDPECLGCQVLSSFEIEIALLRKHMLSRMLSGSPGQIA
jgi:ATP-dependent Clp protease ATP-binding subunit ClpC